MLGNDGLGGTIVSGRYRLEKVIGRGGMSVVYRAHDERLNRDVAVKVFDSSESDRSRFDSEVRILAGLTSPFLVTVHDANLGASGATDPSYLVMELIDGPTLADELRKRPVAGELAAQVAEEISEALHVVHSNGIVHRDLKPSNILLQHSARSPSGYRAELADFGIAHLLGSNRITELGTVVGTAAYLSPEQALGEPAGAASDIYSLALVLIEILNGRAAFVGSQAEVLAARLSRVPELPAGLPQEWQDLVRDMSQRDPSLRPTALDVAVRASQSSGTLVGWRPHSVTEVLPATKVIAAGAGDETVAMDAPTRRLARPVDETVPMTPALAEPERTGHRWRAALIGVAVIVVAIILIAVVLSLGAHTAGVPEPTNSPAPQSSVATPSSSLSSTPSAPPTPGKGKGNGKGHG